MNSEQLLRSVLALPPPWNITQVTLDRESGSVEVHVDHRGRGAACPKCEQEVPGYDVVQRCWRHLDLCEFETWIVGKVPRVNCPEHGVLQIPVPWADARSKFTHPFECVVIDWLKEASMTAVARMLRLGWKQVYNIQCRAVERGLARRGSLSAKRVGVDETSFKKRHEYVTIVTDLDDGAVIHTADDRKQESFEGFLKGLSKEQKSWPTSTTLPR